MWLCKFETSWNYWTVTINSNTYCVDISHCCQACASVLFLVTVQKIGTDYGLLLELHALTPGARSYALLRPTIVWWAPETYKGRYFISINQSKLSLFVFVEVDDAISVSIKGGTPLSHVVLNALGRSLLGLDKISTTLGVYVRVWVWRWVWGGGSVRVWDVRLVYMSPVGPPNM